MSKRFDYEETKKRISKEGYIVKVETSLGSAVKITKVESYKLLNLLAVRKVVPLVEFIKLGNGKYAVFIESK